MFRGLLSCPRLKGVNLSHARTPGNRDIEAFRLGGRIIIKEKNMQNNQNGSAMPAKQKKDAASAVADYFSSVDFQKMEVSIESMFKEGVHFGHHKSRKNPKMDEYIFTTRGGVNIINLEKTAEKLSEAMKFATQTVAEGKDILFVGTKKQAKKIIKAAAECAGMPFVDERWLGGTFTNFKVISERTKYLRDRQEKAEKGDYVKYTKFEQMKIREELERLEKKMGGIKNMTELPGAVFVASTIEDELALKEAMAGNIPVVALVDTNVNPENIDYPIPANEDAVSSLKLIIGYIAKAVLEGKEKRKGAKAEVAGENRSADDDKESKKDVR